MSEKKNQEINVLEPLIKIDLSAVVGETWILHSSVDEIRKALDKHFKAKPETLESLFDFVPERDNEKEAMELAKNIVPLFRGRTLLQIEKAFTLALDSFKEGYIIQ